MKTRISILLILFVLSTSIQSCSIDDELLTELSTGDEIDDPVEPGED